MQSGTVAQVGGAVQMQSGTVAQVGGAVPAAVLRYSAARRRA
jgi:hypothetical protein